ncbi:endolytic transglycosylase MltG [Zobellella endophytica]|uniref:Endolytic murein transglycosylase n=1 Tax=Zobellella endophytica TaxID=2116700 RepID=A0A2P7RCC8_9GAMM|nr:endolytic transglycosylase MltG [Zobellella endophytica]PSJ47812.1 endolytic transglycosylase MltG [Zobellella endophytica]
MNRLIKWLGRLMLLLTLVLLGATGYGVSQWQKLEAMTIAAPSEPLFVVARGETTFNLINRLAAEPVSGLHRRLWLKFHPELAAVRQGVYRLEPGTRLRDALMTFVDGDVYQLRVTLVEGLRLTDWLKRLAESEYLDSELGGVSEAELAERLGVEQGKLEGLFLPETYSYTPGETDLLILQRAHQEMQQFLDEAWEDRAPGLPIASPYEALILASIIEKETGIAEERPLIASVFVNRLRRGMRLQTDPTVIYGMGEDYDGNIRKRDLQTHTAYNTYMIDGLPPTPIAMPSKEAILAALQPAQSDYYYFVAMGEGRHYFSRTLREHNSAVRRYILKR